MARTGRSSTIGPPTTTNPNGDDTALASVFITDPLGGRNDPDEIFTGGGSKDDLDIAAGGVAGATVGPWQHTAGAVPDKDNIENAFAAAYSCPDYVNPDPNSSENEDADNLPDLCLYFGLDRFARNGDAQVGFWFLKEDLNADPDGSFSSPHSVGDILILSDFTNGGAVSTIRIFQWVGTGGDTDGTLDNVANQVACSNSTADIACASANTSVVPSPWFYDAKAGPDGSFPLGSFFEGGVNLNSLGLDIGCGGSFLAETRSSQSVDATLKDFALGDFALCDVSLTSSPSAASIVLGDSITDTANVSGTIAGGGAGPTPTGTVSFYLCGPNVANCATGGSPVPSDPAAEVTLGACNPVQAGHACATSADVGEMVTSIGTWCFRAVYTPAADSEYAGLTAEDGSSGECFTVTDTSSGSTSQSWIPNDSATFSSTGGTTLAGSVTFSLYPSGDCSGTAIFVESRTIGTNTGTATVFTTNGDGDTTGADADEVFDVGDSPLTVSWKAVFTSTNSVSGSSADCEASTLTIDDDVQP
ncbi:MAG TPA: hypothetical protein VFC71_09435 [Candidatus Polarisedimenticolia bacterium]|nr:hypothetical protein [Candidatus Polarisedimenticolia bacterium]